MEINDLLNNILVVTVVILIFSVLAGLVFYKILPHDNTAKGEIAKLKFKFSGGAAIFVVCLVVCFKFYDSGQVKTKYKVLEVSGTVLFDDSLQTERNIQLSQMNPPAIETNNGSFEGRIIVSDNSEPTLLIQSAGYSGSTIKLTTDTSTLSFGAIRYVIEKKSDTKYIIKTPIKLKRIAH
ncbi:MAG: hypothetical protein SFY32_01060 [Bacteroidota bacterium]|nr:hypothetical protein [Bacteroidota bacterium]